MAKNLFEGDYNITGTHADKVRSLTSVFDSKTQSKVFKSAIELYQVAALVGCINERTAEKEKSSNKYTMFSDAFSNHRNSLINIYKLVLLCANSDTISAEDRLNRAYRLYKEEENFNLFISYVLGGIDELYDVFYGDNFVRYDDYKNQMIKLLNEYNTDIQSTDEEDFFATPEF